MRESDLSERFLDGLSEDLVLLVLAVVISWGGHGANAKMYVIDSDATDAGKIILNERRSKSPNSAGPTTTSCLKERARIMNGVASMLITRSPLKINDSPSRVQGILNEIDFPDRV
jgi:hypothetical protein